jgi:DNA-directed RNA polymerase subunit RPC12/RpoP
MENIPQMCENCDLVFIISKDAKGDIVKCPYCEERTLIK